MNQLTFLCSKVIKTVNEGLENHDINSQINESHSQNTPNVPDTMDLGSLEVVSTTTESDVIISLGHQNEYYLNHEQEVVKKDTQKTLQTYIKKIFRQVKFLSDTKKDFHEPNFVQHVHGVRSQSVDICDYLWNSLGE